VEQQPPVVDQDPPAQVHQDPPTEVQHQAQVKVEQEQPPPQKPSTSAGNNCNCLRNKSSGKSCVCVWSLGSIHLAHLNAIPFFCYLAWITLFCYLARRTENVSFSTFQEQLNSHSHLRASSTASLTSSKILSSPLKSNNLMLQNS
jgi:hypothetical protein